MGLQCDVTGQCGVTVWCYSVMLQCDVNGKCGVTVANVVACTTAQSEQCAEDFQQCMGTYMNTMLSSTNQDQACE